MLLKSVELLGKHQSVRDFPSNWLPLVRIITSNEVLTAIKISASQDICVIDYIKLVT